MSTYGNVDGDGDVDGDVDGDGDVDVRLERVAMLTKRSDMGGPRRRGPLRSTSTVAVAVAVNVNAHAR